MRYRILGPLEVLDDGRAVALPGSKPRALLALLLVHHGQTLSSDRIIDELWGDRPPAGAAKGLQVHVSRLRKALAGQDGAASSPIVTRERGYSLSIQPEQLDAWRFERLVADGRAELADGRPQGALAMFEEALALWRGSPLADVAYEPFAQAEIARLDDLWVGALERLIEAKLALGRHTEVVAQLERLIAQHPFREGLRAQLMLALYRCDRQAEALQAYQNARRTLVDQLGIEPGERLRELERAILAQDAGLQFVVASRPGESEPTTEAPRRAFVGRERELAALVAGLEGAVTGRGRLILLAGEPGIGKSRLADALVDRARRMGANAVAGRAWEAGGAPAYWPWIQALRAQIRETEAEALLDQLGDGAAALAQLLPELRDRFPQLPEPPDQVGEGARFRLFEATSSFLRTAADARPLLVVLDDLHAADEPSLLLLRFIVRWLDQSRLLVLGTYRDVDPTLRAPLTSALAEVIREPLTTQITLGGLSAAEIAEYVELSTGVEPAQRLVDTIHAETEGNPLFLSETVHLLAAEGSVGEADAIVRIPPGVRAVIGRRVERLSAPCGELLVLAAVMGREFDLDALAELSGLEPNEMIDVLNEAMAERVLDEVPDAPGRIRFGHVLIRDTLYDELTAARRMQLHGQVGEALEVVYSLDPEPHLAELAQHFAAAAPLGVKHKAIEFARRAGDRAARQLAFEEAARHYEIALTFEHERLARCELLLALGDVEARAGDTTASKRAFREAAVLAEHAGFAQPLAQAALGYGGRFAWARGSTDPELVPLLERALALVDEGDADTRVRLLARLAAAARDDASGARRGDLADEALRLARQSGDLATLAWALEGGWIAVEGPDRYMRREGIAVGDELISLGERLGDQERVYAGRDHLLHSRWVFCDRAGVESELDALDRLAGELRQPPHHWHARMSRAMLDQMDGRFEDAERLVAEAVAIGERAESWNAVVSQRLALFVSRRAQGRLAEIEDVITRAVREYPSLPRFPAALAHLQAELGGDRDARATFDDVLARDLGRHYRDSEWLFTIAVLAEPCARLVDWDAAAELYSMLLAYERLYAQAPVEASFGSVARALGILASTMERYREAERHFELALDVERRMGARPWLANVQHDFATMLLARRASGDADRARALLRDAVTGYRELGMDAWAARAEELGAQLS